MSAYLHVCCYHDLTRRPGKLQVMPSESQIPYQLYSEDFIMLALLVFGIQPSTFLLAGYKA